MPAGVWVCVRARAQSCLQACMCTRMYVHSHVCALACMCTRMHAYTSTHTHMHKSTRPRKRMLARTCACVRSHKHTHSHSLTLSHVRVRAGSIRWCRGTVCCSLASGEGEDAWTHTYHYNKQTRTHMHTHTRRHETDTIIKDPCIHCMYARNMHTRMRTETDTIMKVHECMLLYTCTTCGYTHAFTHNHRRTSHAHTHTSTRARAQTQERLEDELKKAQREVDRYKMLFDDANNVCVCVCVCVWIFVYVSTCMSGFDKAVTVHIAK